MYKYHFPDKKFYKFLCLSVYFVLSIQAIAQQNNDSSLLKVGDKAPRLMISEWIKGKPITEFKSGNIYVVEFWATWCPPCLEVIPHLSKISRKYKKDVTVISVNVMEKTKYPRSRAKAIIDSIGKKIKYSVAFDDSTKMESEWLNRTWRQGVPSAYIVNGNGRIAWIGYPTEMKPIINSILNNSWNIEEEAKKSDYTNQLGIIDDSIGHELQKFYRKGSYSDFYGEPDSTLFHIEKSIKVNPDLKYGYSITFFTFDALLKTDMKRALTYAKEAIQPSNPQGSQHYAIIQGIRHISKFLDLTPELYELGGEIMEMHGGEIPSNLMEASKWYWLGGNKQKAMHCMKKARKAMRIARNNGFGTFF